jgi:undecaprenyl-diphosphatase
MAHHTIFDPTCSRPSRVTLFPMPIYQVVVLAIVQGLTEFLPVSSTAHLHLTSWLLGWKTEALTFDIMLHLGTLIALVVYFLPDWIQIFGQAFGVHIGHDEQLKQNRALLWLLAIGSIPVGIAGLLFEKQADTEWRTPFVMGATLIIIGVVMWMAERSGRRLRDLDSVNFVDACSIGLSQALAVVPGVSRSGITISTGLFRNLTRESAARFSFLLSTPAIAAAAAKAAYDIHKEHGMHEMLSTQFIVGVSVSAIVSFIVIAWFLHYLRRSSLMPFVYYRIAFGIIVLALAFIRRPA